MNTPSLEPISPARRPRRLLLGMAALALVVAAAAVTVVVRSVPEAQAAPPAAAAAQAAQPAASTPTHAEGVAMVEKLAARLKAQPEDLEGWLMLTRAYNVMERTDDAVAAQRQVLRLSPGDAQAHAELARAIGRANGRKLNAEAEGLLKKALVIDKENVTAHALLGKLALDRGQSASAKKHFEDALAHMDQEHPFAQQLRTAIQIAGGAPALAASSTTQ